MSVRQEKVLGGIASTCSRLLSKWREVKVESEFFGWHTAHCFTVLQGEHWKTLARQGGWGGGGSLFTWSSKVEELA